MQIEDRFARAFDQAARFAIRDCRIAADQIHRQLHDHPNAAEPAPLEERGAHLRRRFSLEFRHRSVRPANAGSDRSIPWLRGYAGTRSRGARTTTEPRNRGTAQPRKSRVLTIALGPDLVRDRVLDARFVIPN